MEQVKEQLKKMNMISDSITEICYKDGICLYRLRCGKDSYVLKYFESIPDRREINNYKILESLNVSTLKLISHTNCCILMEDIAESHVYRIGINEDLNDIQVAAEVAKWYKELHQKGKCFVRNYNGTLYDENDFITLENIHFIKTKTATAHNPVWDIMEKNFETMRNCVDRAERTLTYNDFYYTNLIVAKDKSSAYMFDYNLLGKGYVYSDIRNVCSSLGAEAKKVFLSSYGEFNKDEVILDDVSSLLTTLFFACKRDRFPKWAESYLHDLNDNFMVKLQMLFNLY